MIEFGPTSPAGIRDQVLEVLKSCYDPEIPVNVFDLGLIYEIDVQPGGLVTVKMTLTSPSCPVAESLPPEIQEKIARISGVVEAKVDVVWEPPWTMERMSEAARLELNMF